MIQKVSIKDIATFNADGIVVDDMKMVNIIYGSNGTGKSTISKVLAHIEEYPQCQISWKNDIQMDLLVYNREFCEKNYSEFKFRKLG